MNLEKVIVREIIALRDGQAVLDTGEVLLAPEGSRVKARVVLRRGPEGSRLERLWDVAPDRITAPPGTLLAPYDGPPELLDSPANALVLAGKLVYATPASSAPWVSKPFEPDPRYTLEGHALAGDRFWPAVVRRDGKPLSRRLAYGFFKDRRLKPVPIAWEKWRYDPVRETPDRLRGYALGARNASAPVLQVVGLRIRVEDDPSIFFDVY